MAKEFVESTIHDPHNRVVIFSKSYDAQSSKAKQTLKHMVDPDYMQVVELDEKLEGEAIQLYLEQISGNSNLPFVFVDGVYFGGGKEVAEKASSQELQMTLQMKGVPLQGSEQS